LNYPVHIMNGCTFMLDRLPAHLASKYAEIKEKCDSRTGKTTEALSTVLN